MIWVFFIIVLGLSGMYLFGEKSEKKEISILNSESFLVTAILSTLAAHGILSLAEEKEMGDVTLLELQDILLGNGFLDEGQWNHYLTDHFYDVTPLVDSKDFDMG